MNLEEMYREIERHLLQDERPSEYLEKAGNMEVFGRYPFNLLNQMKKTKQSPKYHPEGNVWVHTMMVVDMAAKNREFSRNLRVFMWAALLHDMGKPICTKIRNGKITSYNHDIEGEKLVREFLQVFTEDQAFIEAVSSLVRFHMQILFVTKGASRAQVKEMKRRVDVREAALLGLCDRMGRTGADAEREKASVRKFLQACDVREADLEFVE